MNTIRRISLGLLLVVQLVLGLAAAGAFFPWLGHESDYFNVVRFLNENGRLPARSDFEGAERSADISQVTQPPLFSYTALPVVALLDDRSAVPPGIYPGLICEGAPGGSSYQYALTTPYNNPTSGAPAAGLGLRLLNLCFALGMTALVYFTARQLAPNSVSTALTAAAFSAFLPQIFELGVFISGESLLLLISAANLFFAVRLIRSSTVSIIEVSGLIITAVLGPLTKSNGYVLIISTAAVLVYLLLKHMTRNPRARTTRILMVGAAALIIGIVALSLFNYANYGSIVGRYQNLLTIALARLQDLSLENIYYVLQDTYHDYISVLPIQNKAVVILYTLGGIAGLLLFAVHTISALVKRDRRVLTPYALLLLYALAAIALVLLRGNLVNDIAPDKTHTPVRYYISGLPAMAVMSALGWHALTRSRLVSRILPSRVSERFLAGNVPGLLWAVVWMLVSTLLVVQAIRLHPSNYTFTPDAFAAFAQANNLTVTADNGTTGNIPRLHAYQYNPSDDGILRVTAYMSVGETPAVNYVARVTAVGASGEESTCELIPQRGRYPVTRWEPNQIVAVEMEIPNCSAEAMSGPIDVSIDWLAAGMTGEYLEQDALAGAEFVIDADLLRARFCLGNLGVIDGVFQVIQYNGPQTITRGENFLPSVNWYIRDNILNSDLTRVYTLAHKDSEMSFACEGVPRLGDYPIAQWRRGETIYFDQCLFSLPADAPSGLYRLSIGLKDNTTGTYAPIEGSTSGVEMLDIAEINLP